MRMNSDRYCDYVHRLYQISGLPAYFIDSDILPLRYIPHKDDPRRERSLKQVLDIQLSNEEKPLGVVVDEPKDTDYQRLLHHIVVSAKRSTPLSDIAHMPNCRDPRRFRACKRRGFLVSKIGPPTLVENPEIPAEEETCPVLTIDYRDWPRSQYSCIELVPHECNILRASEFVCSANEQLVDCDNEGVVEIIDDDVTEVSGYDAGDSNKPMLEIADGFNDSFYDVEMSRKRFFGDDEPTPLTKREPTPERAVPSFNESSIDVVDLCSSDDDDHNDEYVNEKSATVIHLINLDSDEEEEGNNGRRRNSVVSSDNGTAVQLINFMSWNSELAKHPVISTSFQNEEDSVIDNVIDEDTAMDVGETITADKAPNWGQSFKHVGRSIIQPERDLTNCGDFEECRQISKSSENHNQSEIRKISYSIENDADEPECSMKLQISASNMSEKRVSRRISIVTSDDFNAQKKRLIDVISKTNNVDESDIENTPRTVATEQLQQLINKMTSANYLGRAVVVSNYEATEQTENRCLQKRRDDDSPELNDHRQFIVEARLSSEKNLLAEAATESFAMERTETKSAKTRSQRQRQTRRQEERELHTKANVENIDEAVKSVQAIKPAGTIFPPYQNKSAFSIPIGNNSILRISASLIDFNRMMLNNIINYILNYSIEPLSIKLLLNDYGGLNILTIMQVVNETFWHNRYNYWNNKDKGRCLHAESTNLSIRDDTMATLPRDDQTKTKINTAYFLKDPAPKSNKLQVHSSASNTAKKLVEPNDFDNSGSNLEINKINKRHSLPTAIIPKLKTDFKRVRSNSMDSWYNGTDNSIKMKLTRDQSNQQNWIASKKYTFNETVHKFNYSKEEISHKDNAFQPNKPYTKEKANCHLITDVPKFQFCSDKTVQELENDDYISTPVFNWNNHEKQCLEQNLSPFLKSKLKRQHGCEEILDINQRLYCESKRPKLHENSFCTEANINININIGNDVNNHEYYSDIQEQKLLAISKTLNDCSEKNLPKNYNNVSNLNISLSYRDKSKKQDVHDNSNIAKDNPEKQVMPCSEKLNSNVYRKKKRTSQYMDERKKKKISQKFALIFGDSDFDALEDLSSPNDLHTDNGCDDNKYDSKDECHKNTVQLDEKDMKTKSLEIVPINSKVTSVLESAKKSSEIFKNHLQIEQTNQLSISIQENQESKELDINNDSMKQSDKYIKSNKPLHTLMHVSELQNLSKNNNLGSNVLLVNEESKESLEKSVHDVPFENTSSNKQVMLGKNSKILIPNENLLAADGTESVLKNLNSINNLANDNDGIVDTRTVNLEEGDFDFEVDISSECSYDGSTNSDDAEFRTINGTNCVTVQQLGDNENSNSYEIIIEEYNDPVLDRTSELINKRVPEVHNVVAENSCINIDHGATVNFNSHNKEKTNLTSETKVSAPTISHDMITHNEGKSVNEINRLSSINKHLMSLKNDTVQSRDNSIFSTNRNFYDDLNNQVILKMYNIFMEESYSEQTISKSYELIENLEVEEAWKSLNTVNSKILLSKKTLEECSTPLTYGELKSMTEDFKKFNIIYVHIDSENLSNLVDSTDESNSTVKRNVDIHFDNINNSVNSIDNSNASVKSSSNIFKLRDINDLLEKSKTSPRNRNVTNEKTLDDVYITSANSSQPEEMIQLNAISNSIFFTFNRLINHMSVPQPNNKSCKSILSTNSILQSMALTKDSQVCIKLASNIYSNEFSTLNELPTIFSMEPPPLNTLKLLLPKCAESKKVLREYKEKLLNKLDSNLEIVQIKYKQDFLKYSNDLLNYNTLSLETWNFQSVILTIIQCLSRLIFCACEEKKWHIIQIIEKTTSMSKLKQCYLEKAINLYLKLAKQGLCHKHIFLYDPIYIETVGHNNLTLKDLKMTLDQNAIFLEQIKFYRSLQNLPHINILV